jgi:hypothetical protein
MAAYRNWEALRFDAGRGGVTVPRSVVTGLLTPSIDLCTGDWTPRKAEALNECTHMKLNWNGVFEGKTQPTVVKTNLFVLDTLTGRRKDGFESVILLRVDQKNDGVIVPPVDAVHTITGTCKLGC